VERDQRRRRFSPFRGNSLAVRRPTLSTKALAVPKLAPGASRAMASYSQLSTGSWAGRAAHERQPDVRAERIVRAARGDADHQAIRAAHLDASADDRGIGAKAPLPQRFADDDRALGVLKVIVGTEEASDDRLRAQDGEEVLGDRGGVHALGRCVLRGEIRRHQLGDGDLGEHLAVGFPQQVVVVRDGLPDGAQRRVDGHRVHEFIGMRVRETRAAARRSPC
jgi:hypothetical protein